MFSARTRADAGAGDFKVKEGGPGEGGGVIPVASQVYTKVFLE